MLGILRTSRFLIARAAFLFCACALTAQPGLADFVQRSPKLVGAGAVGASAQGYSVALSADGNTAIVGGINESRSTGAAWVYVRSNGVWSPQGGKLVGLGAVGPPSYQGSSVALSGDGNTAAVGGSGDNGGIGAVWVFVRSNGNWSQQGGKLVGTGNVGTSNQGSSISLSADGNTLLVGGNEDNSSYGAAWVFTRSGASWAQQGSKLLPVDAIPTDGFVDFGGSVSLSGDGNTAMIGGLGDGDATGAAWIFTRSSGRWSQYGNKLVGTDSVYQGGQGKSVALSADGKTAAFGMQSQSLNQNIGAAWIFTFSGGNWTQQRKIIGADTVGYAQQGYSVSLSGDGDTLVSGAKNDANGIGATLVFIRSNGQWTQHDPKLVGAPAAGASQQGQSVALSADGSTIIVGGDGDGSNAGAAWIWLRRDTPHDFNNNAKSDIFWRNTGGSNVLWLMSGVTVSSVATLGGVDTSWTPVGQRDFDGDGKADILWRNSAGSNAIWFMSGATVNSVALIGGVPTNWYVAGTGDVNGDGKGDIIWRNADGVVAVWLMNGATVSSVAVLGSVATNWTIYSTADFDGDGKTDLLWRNTDGSNAIWLMNGTSAPAVTVISGVSPSWTPVVTADFNGDGKGDILWRNSDGSNAVWLMNGTTASSVALIGSVGTTWSVAGTGDFDGDGKGDILWREAGGSNAIWFMDGTSVSSVRAISGVATNWSVQNAGAN